MQTHHPLGPLWFIGLFLCFVVSVAHAQNRVPTSPVDGQYIKEWLVLGPFFPNDLDTDFLADAGGEAKVDPKVGDTVTTSDGKTLTWKPHTTKGNVIDLTGAVGDHENTTAYLFCRLQSQVAGNLTMSVYGRDGADIWVNGRRVYHNPRDFDETSEANLKARTNLCLVKVYREIERWHFSMRVFPPDHDAIIEGTLLMLDETTPHVAVPVQAMKNGKIIAGTLSDKKGEYQFINLKPGTYQVRCHVLGGYIYYGRKKGIVVETHRGASLQVERGKTLKNIDFLIPPFKKGSWETYNYLLNGLAGNYIAAIDQDPDGVLWFGADGGVSRYDGKAFVSFTEKDGLAGNRVRAIHCTPDGVIWIGTNGGVSRYDGKEGPRFVNFTEKDGLADNVVYAIHRDPDGAMWFGTRGGLSRYDGTKFVNFTEKDGLVDNVVRAIHRDPDGAMWFGTPGGLSRYDGKGGPRFVNFTTKDGLADNSIWAIDQDPDGVLWFGTVGGVSRYDRKGFINFTTKDVWWITLSMPSMMTPLVCCGSGQMAVFLAMMGVSLSTSPQKTDCPIMVSLLFIVTPMEQCGLGQVAVFLATVGRAGRALSTS